MQDSSLPEAVVGRKQKHAINFHQIPVPNVRNSFGTIFARLEHNQKVFVYICIPEKVEKSCLKLETALRHIGLTECVHEKNRCL